MRNKNVRIARLTGASLLIMAVLAMVAMLGFFEKAFQLNSEELNRYTSKHMTEYQIGVGAWIGILVLDLLVSWGLYQILKSHDKLKALATSLLRLLYSCILAWATLHLIRVSPMSLFPENSHFVFDHVHQFESIWSNGLILFGFHLILLGLMIPTRRLMLTLIKWMLILGGIGYILIHSGPLLASNFTEAKSLLESIFMAPMILGELGFALMILIKPGLLLNTLGSNSFTDTTQ